MPRPREMSRPGEKEVDAKDAQLLAEVEGNVSLSPEQQELVQRAEADLQQYGKLTTSERKTLKKIASKSE